MIYITIKGYVHRLAVDTSEPDQVQKGASILERALGMKK